jgi:hypothetical protein
MDNVQIYNICRKVNSCLRNNEVGLEVNTKKTKYMLLSRHQNSGQNHNIKIGNRCFETMAQIRYLGTTITNQNPRVMVATI